MKRALPPAGLAAVMALMLGSQALAQGNSGKPPKPAAAAVSLDARPNPLSSSAR